MPRTHPQPGRTSTTARLPHLFGRGARTRAVASPGAARVLLVASLVAAAAAACGDDATSSGAFGARPATGITLGAKLTVGGTVSLTANWTDGISAAASARTCADATKGFVQDGLRYTLPRPPGTASFGGHVVAVMAIISGYHGPGSYTSPAIAGADGSQTLLDLDGQGWAATGGGTAQVDVHADDSGLLVFQKLTPAGAAASAAPGAPPPQKAGSLTGTLSWTCSQVGTDAATGSPSAQIAAPSAATTTPAPTPALNSGGPTPTP